MIDKDRFKLLCEREGYISGASDDASIGIYNEKRLHRLLKNTLCENAECHEVKIGRYVADVLESELISEIQCASTAPLLPKIRYYLNETDYSVRVVIPLVSEKTLIRAERETGEIIRIKRSPKRQTFYDLLARLYPLRELLLDGRVSVLAVCVRVEEYRYSEPMRYRKEGRYDSDVFPQEILDVKQLLGVDGYRALLPKALGDTEFSAADFSRETKLRGRDVYSALNLLVGLGLLMREKRGRAMSYKII